LLTLNGLLPQKNTKTPRLKLIQVPRVKTELHQFLGKGYIGF
jgi:hypothetical protein